MAVSHRVPTDNLRRDLPAPEILTGSLSGEPEERCVEGRPPLILPRPDPVRTHGSNVVSYPQPPSFGHLGDVSGPAEQALPSIQTPFSSPLEGVNGLTAPDILVADDEESCRLVIDAILLALQVLNPRVHVRDGDEAVRYLERCVETPALVVLDGNMPGRSGFEVLRWMRGRPELASVPVVMLTGSSDVASIREAYDFGAASYLVKPVAFDALAEVVRGLDRPWVLL